MSLDDGTKLGANVRLPPLPIRSSILALRIHGVALAVIASVVLVAVAFESNETAQVILVAGIIAFGLPAILCFLLPRAIQKKKIWGYVAAWLIHATFAYFTAIVVAGVAFGGAHSLSWVVAAVIAGPLSLLHAWIAIGMILPRSRAWLAAADQRTTA